MVDSGWVEKAHEKFPNLSLQVVEDFLTRAGCFSSASKFYS